MNSNSRIAKLLDAVLAMKAGLFNVSIPVDGEDEVARLARAINDLGKTLEGKFEEIRKIHAITADIHAGLVLDEILDHVFDTFRTVIPYNRIGCSLLEENGTVVRARWARSDVPVMGIEKGYSAPLRGSSLQQIIESRKPRVLNNLLDYLREHPKSDSTWRIVKEGMRSSLTCPLLHSGKPIGFLFFSSLKPNTYKQVHTETFLQISTLLSSIVEKGTVGANTGNTMQTPFL
ncbi:MAG: GAF domain-containing protein [Bacteroidota bacterium]